MANVLDDISIHVFKGVKLMGIYEEITGFPRLDNMLKNDGADRDGDFRGEELDMEWAIEEKPKSTYGPNYKESRFRFITEEMTTLYSKKNMDYGDAFTQSLDEDGLLVSKIRIKDKLNRFSQLIDNDALVNDESMRDTLIDLANYTVMTLMWLDENE